MKKFQIWDIDGGNNEDELVEFEGYDINAAVKAWFQSIDDGSLEKTVVKARERPDDPWTKFEVKVRHETTIEIHEKR